MKLAIVGTGYVGLVTGACFAEMGNQVICIDHDQNKITQLEKGIMPIYEPGLEQMVNSNARAGRLSFSTSLQQVLELGDIDGYFIAVGTPPGENGRADLQYVLAVAKEIGRYLRQSRALIVNKSTVPVGTAAQVKRVVLDELQRRQAEVEIAVVSNPEFLKEGAAIEDFMRPDRVVVGADAEWARDLMQELYAPFNRSHQRVIFMGVKDAELTKYAANAMLATKISFMNEIACLCEAMGVDVENVRIGIGSDSRIGYSFIYPGCGYGGSCFPKDVKALIYMAHSHQLSPTVLEAVETRNAAQKQRLFEKVTERFGPNLQGYHFAVWGLAFKPGTDDLREASSIVLINQLVKAGASVCAYDPIAMEGATQHFPQSWQQNGQIRFADHQYDALQNADALILVTEWKQFRHPDFKAMKKLLKHAIIFDGRNQYSPRQMKTEGFEYSGIGRILISSTQSES